MEKHTVPYPTTCTDVTINYVLQQLDNVVKTTDYKHITTALIFTESPTAPVPTAKEHVATKDYVDTIIMKAELGEVASVDFTDIKEDISLLKTKIENTESYNLTKFEDFVKNNPINI